MNSENWAPGDPYFNVAVAERAMHQLHADGAARQLVADRWRARPRKTALRWRFAAVLRRTADRLAPQAASAECRPSSPGLT